MQPTDTKGKAFDRVGISVFTSLEDGIDIHVVSDRLDHSSIHVTSQIYTHVRRPMQSDAADRVAARILGRT